MGACTQHRENIHKSLQVSMIQSCLTGFGLSVPFQSPDLRSHILDQPNAELHIANGCDPNLDPTHLMLLLLSYVRVMIGFYGDTTEHAMTPPDSIRLLFLLFNNFNKNIFLYIQVSKSVT
jgi:hypothetical protein